MSLHDSDSRFTNGRKSTIEGHPINGDTAFDTAEAQLRNGAGAPQEKTPSADAQAASADEPPHDSDRHASAGGPSGSDGNGRMHRVGRWMKKHPPASIGIFLAVVAVVLSIYAMSHPAPAIETRAPSSEEVIGRAMAEAYRTVSTPLYEFGSSVTKSLADIRGKLGDAFGRIDANRKDIDALRTDVKGMKDEQLNQQRILDSFKKQLDERPLPKLEQVPMSQTEPGQGGSATAPGNFPRLAA